MLGVEMRRLITAVFVALVAASANAADLRPHVATYTPKLRGAPANLALTGQISLSSAIRCKTWMLNHSSAVALGPKGKPMIAMVRVQQGEESRDGKTFAYSTQMSIHGNRSSIKETGVTAGKGKSGRIEVQTGDSKRTVEISEGTYLPMAALEKVIDELSAGKKSFILREYSVSLTHSVVEMKYEVVNFSFSDAPLPSDPDGLLKGPSWIVRSTMVVNGQTVENVFQLHRSGVLSRMLQTVNDVTIEFTAASLQAVPEADC
jgi:hypothetical protein